ncbi:hypothetical protein JOL62DRAFT_383818 [Phyllosticta paracitricarpa]|uniref:Uncharacterized protein n=1 Tax=Phyllosticta paracitricarpa TaxID=2016321 RepID=A0ABR1NEH9_9PEZI
MGRSFDALEKSERPSPVEDARLRNIDDVAGIFITSTRFHVANDDGLVTRYPHIFNSQPLFAIPSIDEVLHISRVEIPARRRPLLRHQFEGPMSIPESFTEQDLLPFRFDETPRPRHKPHCIAVNIYSALEQGYPDQSRREEAILFPEYLARTTYEPMMCQTEPRPQTLADLVDQYQGLHRCNSWESLSSRNSTANLYTIREEPEPPESNVHVPILHLSKLAMVRRKPVISRKPVNKSRPR